MSPDPSASRGAPDRLPVYAISHGGGPWPWIKDHFLGDWGPLERSLQAIPEEIGRMPSAIVCITAHWIGRDFVVQNGAQPPMLYDYHGFPAFTYELQYPAPGSPELADRVAALIGDAGIEVRTDPRRGYDHGTFVPLAVAFPDGSVPVVQLSIRGDFDPDAHLTVGRALAPLRDDDVLILGSGVPTFHNLAALGPTALAPSTAFDRWLRGTVLDRIGADRSAHLAHWADAPRARECHPQPDHLLPLLVAAGAGEDDPATLHHHEDAFMGFTASSSFRFG